MSIQFDPQRDRIVLVQGGAMPCGMAGSLPHFRAIPSRPGDKPDGRWFQAVPDPPRLHPVEFCVCHEVVVGTIEALVQRYRGQLEKAVAAAFNLDHPATASFAADHKRLQDRYDRAYGPDRDQVTVIPLVHDGDQRDKSYREYRDRLARGQMLVECLLEGAKGFVLQNNGQEPIAVTVPRHLLPDLLVAMQERNSDQPVTEGDILRNGIFGWQVILGNSIQFE